MGAQALYLAGKPSTRKIIKFGSTIILLFLLTFLCTPVMAFETEVMEGSLTVSGKAAPDEKLKFAASFQMQLPVEADQYEYETRITVPQKPNRFTVKVQNVQEINAGVKMGIWLTRHFEASGGVATLSQSNVPPGSYDLKIFGQALGGSSSILVDVTAETEVKADENGDYNLAIKTPGMPSGQYTIRGAGQTKTLQVNATDHQVSSSGTASSPSPGPQPSAPVEISREVLEWYSTRIGKDASNSTQLAETETLLKSRLKGGYWKVISRGEPLTEEAGACLQNYCLVRGNGACSSCRQKDQILKNGKSSPSTPRTQSSTRNESNDSSKPKTQTDNLITRLLNWVIDLFLGGRRQ